MRIVRVPIDRPYFHRTRAPDLHSERGRDHAHPDGYLSVLTTTVDNIEHIESTTVNGQAIVKIFLQPGSNLETGSQRDMRISTSSDQG